MMQVGTWSRARLVVAAALVLAAGLAALASASPATAATFTVNSTADLADANPGDGSCATAGGQCTLRAAVQENNAPPNGQDTVVVPAGDYQLNDFSGAYFIDDDVRLEGAGAASTVIHPTSSAQLFFVDAGAELQLRDVTLQGGVGTDGGAIHNEGDLVVFRSILRANRATRGAAIYTEAPVDVIESTIGGPAPADANLASVGGGGIYVAVTNSGMIKLERSAVRGNWVDSPSGAGVGGGIAVPSTSAELEVVGSSIVDNHASTSTNGVGSEGGGIATSSDLTITDSVVDGNQATSTAGGLSSGGGIAVRANLAIARSTVSRNYAEGTGGGIWLVAGPASTVGSLTESTLWGNTAQGQGAGVWVNRPLVVVNSTVTVNLALAGGGVGGGAYVSNNGALLLTHSTLAGNIASQGKAIYTAAPPGGGFLPRVSLRSSVIDGSTSPLCSKTPAAQAITSLGFNVVGDASCNVTSPNDVANADPKLSPLADNGGPTETHAIDPASPAADLVTAGCPPPLTDQRGVARPQQAACDAGSFEFAPAPAPAPSPPPTGSLALEASAKSKQRLKKLKVRVECPHEACDVTAGGKVKSKVSGAASRQPSAAKPKRFKLRPSRATLVAAEPAKLRLKPKRGARRKLTRLLGDGAKATARIEIIATDAAGDQAARKLKVRLRR